MNPGSFLAICHVERDYPGMSANGLIILLQATFDCLMRTYGFLTPDFWTETRFRKSPFQEYTDFLAKPISSIKPAIIEDVERVEA